jgi:hypothetical protein
MPSATNLVSFLRLVALVRTAAAEICSGDSMEADFFSREMGHGPMPSTSDGSTSA